MLPSTKRQKIIKLIGISIFFALSAAVITAFVLPSEKERLLRYRQGYNDVLENEEKPKFEAITGKMAEISKKHQLMETRLDEFQKIIEETATRKNRNSVRSSHEQMSTEERREAAIEKYNHYVGQLDEKIDNESIDNSWSYDAIRTVNRVFQNDKMNNIDLVEVDCRSTLCRVELNTEYGDKDKNEQISGLLSELWNGETFFRLGDEEAVIYISREGHSLLQSNFD